jgi:aminomethyltransferase
MSLQTVLNPEHRRLGARMTDFGGWEMPLHYGSQIEEHHAVRRGCGIFDISHMQAADLSGADAKPFLRRILANDVAKLTVAGKALYSCLLNAKGGVIDDLIVYRLGEGADRYRLVLNAATAPSDLDWLQYHITECGALATLTPRRDLAMIALQGPASQATLTQAWPETEAEAVIADLRPFNAVQHGELFLARTGYTGEDGFEILMPADKAGAIWQTLLAAGATPCGLGARDTLRLEAGMNLYGQDMDAGTSPLDAGLGWTVALNDERDFIGKAALLTAGERSAFFGLVLIDQGVLRAHQSVTSALGSGIITSGSFSPTLQQSIGLARLPLGTQPGDTVQVDIRGRLVNARVVKPPFVRHGHILV